jgi:DNA-binding NarL/FixJ family response regulator
MPHRSGLEILQHMVSAYPEVGVLMLDSLPTMKYGRKVLRAGATGYIWPVGKIRVKSAHSVQKPGKDRLSDALIAGRKPARADSLRFSNRGSFSNQSTSIILRDPREPKPRTLPMGLECAGLLRVAHAKSN